MAEYLTVVYRYTDKEAMRQFFQDHIAPMNCAFSDNDDKPVVVTSYASEDALQRLHNLEITGQL